MESGRVGDRRLVSEAASNLDLLEPYTSEGADTNALVYTGHHSRATVYAPFFQ